MTSLLEFAIIVIRLSVSGVMSPGPVFTANVAYGVKGGWRSGVRMAYGHTIVELPMLILLVICAISITTFPQFREYISTLGAISLFAFAGLQLKGIFTKSSQYYSSKHGPLFAGILLSALNPFFLIWWFTIGFKLITDALILYSFVGIAIMFAFHIWMDYAWLGGVGFLSSKGKKILSAKNYRVFIVTISGVLVYFGVSFLLQTLH